MKNRLYEDLKQAMKNKETIRRNTIQLLRAEILKREKDTGREMTDEDIIRLIKKEKDARFDLMKQIEGSGRDDLMTQALEESNILSQYLPKYLSEEELVEQVIKTLQEIDATTPKDMGKAMKTCKEKYEMVSHPKVLANIVKEILQNGDNK